VAKPESGGRPAAESARSTRRPADTKPPPPSKPPPRPSDGNLAASVKPTGRPTDAAVIRATGRFPAVKPTGRQTQVPSWRPPPRQQTPVWTVLLLLVIVLLLVVLAVLVYSRRGGSGSPSGTGNFETEDRVSLRVVVAGQPAAGVLPLTVRRHGNHEPIRITPAVLPPLVSVQPATLPPDQETVELKVTTEPGVRPMVTSVPLTVEGGGQRKEVWLTLTVLLLPPGYRAAAKTGVEEDAAHRPYYHQIVRDLDPDTSVEFVLVPKINDSDPPTFYIMVNKVSVGLFKRYARDNPRNPPQGWNEKDPADFPALKVRWQDAVGFAEWLGGKLPSAQQWDKAFGRFDRKGRPGPFPGNWTDPKTLNIAVGGKGPRPVGDARDDVSFAGCHDMAGNGLEWTSSTANGSRLEAVEPGRQARILLRGRPWTHPSPLLFDDLQERQTMGTDEADGLVGFRVVLELP
jgi:hypothetical protein